MAQFKQFFPSYVSVFLSLTKTDDDVEELQEDIHTRNTCMHS